MPVDPQPLPFDYNDALFRHGAEPHGLDHSTLRDEYRDIHPFVADKLMLAKAAPVLDMGCGPTKLGTQLDQRGVPWIGVDAALRRLQLGTGPRLLGDAVRLPFRNASFGAVTALYVLYHFADPLLPIREAHRVLRPGGLFAACAPSRFDDPELAQFMPPKPPETFDSDLAPAMLATVFDDIHEDRWEMPLYRFADRDGLWHYLVARGHSPAVADEVARQVEYPLWITKRGATVWGRKR